ncbi:MAG: sigma-54 dependent transcriptional regulator [Nitrospirota bacterium]
MDYKGKLLIVEDEKITLENLEYVMQKEGYEVESSNNGSDAIKILEQQMFDLVLTDLRMGKVDGMQVLSKCKELYPYSEVIIITAFASLTSAVDTMKKGAYSYIAKPFKLDEVRKVVREAIEKVKLKKENARLREQLEGYKGKVKIISQDPKIQDLLATAKQIGPTDCNVIISGKSGTGKELFARYIHDCSSRTEKPFFAINCGAFTESILTSELFGYEKGAFTGASERKKGLIEMASDGTLLLDEITEMDPAMQAKLLRVIQEKEVLRLGATSPVEVNVRFIAATNRDIKESIRAGQFRQDLFFRLDVVSFFIPPLAERRDDIPLLVHYFLDKFSVIMDKSVLDISKDVLSILMSYNFPGNVRELENIIERGVALANGNEIDVSHLPEDLRNLSVKIFKKKDGRIQSLEEQEIAYIQWVLSEVSGNKTLAAQNLGIDRVSLWRKLKKYGLEAEA